MESTLFHGAGALGVQLIETLCWDGAQLVRGDLHLARLAQGALALGYPYNAQAARAALIGAGQGAPARLRLTSDARGQIAVTSAPMPAPISLWRVGLAAQRLNSADPYLRIKSTQRPAYDAARAEMAAGLDEVILLNERGEVADGSITTLFFDRGQGLRTPPLSSGALPGVLRAHLAAPEETLVPRDLGTVTLWLGNSLRGLSPARWVGG
ncbi:MAG: aminotransferase class IV family protein [Cypionkella sp.]|nr:aminotransferase class IV family protein [Cypionkella sp.]